MRAFEPDDVMVVSTFWRQVVLQTPALWSRIIMTDLPSQEHIAPRMKRFLERSKDHALHIELSVSESSWGAWRYEETLDALAKLLRPHMRRCVYFGLGRGFDSVTMFQLVTELSPDIEYISLPEGFPLGGQNDVLVDGLRVRDQKAANLRWISGPLPYSTFVGIHFPVLKHLELTTEGPVEWEMLLNLLTNTPILRTLIIAKQELQVSPYSDFISVLLARLTTLRLIEWSAENLNLFFTYVSTPDLQELALLNTSAHAYPLDLIEQVKKLELPANSTTGWTARVLRKATEVEELTMTSTTANREILELLANQLEGNPSVQHGSRAWLVPKMMRMEMDCSNVSGYPRVPVQELRGVLRRRRLGGVREISKLTLLGVEENEIERLKGELDNEVERLEVLPPPKAATSGPARSWLPNRRRSRSPVIISHPRRHRHQPYLPGRPMRSRSRSWSRSPPRRPVSRSPRSYTPPRRASPVPVPLVIPPLRTQPIVILPPNSRSPTPPTPPSPLPSFWRCGYVPPSTEISPIILHHERRGRSRSRLSTPPIRSRSASPPIVPPVILSQVSQNSVQEEWRRGDDVAIRPMDTIPEASSVHFPPPDQPVSAAQDYSQDGPRRVTTFGRIPRYRSFGSSPPFSSYHPSPSYTPPRRPVQLTIPPPSSPHPIFTSAQGLRTEESRNSRYHSPYRYYGRPATPPAMEHWPPPSPPVLNVPQQPSVWADPSSSGPRVSSPHLEPQRPDIATESAPWLNGPTYAHPMGRFIPNATIVPAMQTHPEPFVVQVPSHPSNRVVARVVRRTRTPPLGSSFAFGPSVPPAQQICSGFVLQMQATGAAAPPYVMVSSNT